MTFCQTIIAEIVGGIISGLIIAVGLYFVFDKIIVKKAKLRLYIEPNNINSNEFTLNFYIKNIGSFNAKNTLLIMSFPDLEIIEESFTGEKRHKRIDYLYGNTPTVQINFDRPIFRYDKSNQHIASIKFRYKGTKEIAIRYSVEAENMDYFEDVYRIPVYIKI